MALRWWGLALLFSRCDAFWDINEKYIVTLAEGVQVQTNPGGDSEISSRYPFGKVFTVLDRVDIDGHEYVRTEAGWISVVCSDTAEHIAEKVFISDPGELYMSTSAEGALVQSGASSLSASVRVIPQGGLFHVIERFVNEHGVLRLRLNEGGWVNDVNLQDGGMIAEPVMPKTPEHHIVNCPRGLIVRGGADLSSEIVEWLKPEEKLEVFERATVGNGTIRLRTSGGWVSQASKTTGTAITTRVRSCRGQLAFDVVEDSNITEPKDTSLASDALLDAFIGVMGDNESAEEVVLEASFADGSSMVVSPGNSRIMSFSGSTASESQVAAESFFSTLEDNACFWKNCGAKVLDSLHQQVKEANSAGLDANSVGAALAPGSSSGVTDGAVQVHDVSAGEHEDEQPFFTLTLDHPEHVKQLEATIAVHKAVYQGQDSTRVGFHLYRSDSVWRYNPCNGKPMAVRETPHIAAQKTNSYKFPGETFAVDQTLEDETVRFLRLADGSGWLFDQTPTCKLCEPVSGWMVKQKGLDQDGDKREGGLSSSYRLPVAEVEASPLASNPALPTPTKTSSRTVSPVTPKPLSQFTASSYPTVETMSQLRSKFEAATFRSR